jgi:hypothetical protein
MGKAMTEQVLFILDVRARDVECEITLNGITVWSACAVGDLRHQQVVNPFVDDGANKLTARVTPLAEGQPALAYRLVHTFRAAGAPEKTLIARVLPDPASPLVVGGPARSLADAADFPSPFGRWAWQKPGARVFTPEDRADIIAQVAAVHDALSRGDEAALLSLLHEKFQELGRAMMLSGQELADDAREHFQDLFASQGWSLAPLDPESIQIKPMADGRLVAPVRASGRSLLESAGGEPYGLDLMMAFGDGRWRIVR